jgi:hypothetical protein
LGHRLSCACGNLLVCLRYAGAAALLLPQNQSLYHKTASVPQAHELLDGTPISDKEK